MHGPVANQVANGLVYKLLLPDAAQALEGGTLDPDIKTVSLTRDLDLSFAKVIADPVCKRFQFDRRVHDGAEVTTPGRVRCVPAARIARCWTGMPRNIPFSRVARQTVGLTQHRHVAMLETHGTTIPRNPSMWLPVLALIVGFIALVWSADRFVAGAAATANNLGASKILIGLTVVSIGTSAPEILVALAAAIEGTSILAIGNAIGSNIANIGLVLGVTAIVAPLPFAASVLKVELPWLIGATLLALLCLYDLHLGVADGLLLLAGLSLIIHRLVRERRKPEQLPDSIQEELEELEDMPIARALVYLVVGLGVLLVSAQTLVWAATEVAEYLGVSELIIGLTVIAVGTSLPELAATLAAALKGHPDIAIGNVVGSNILNIVAVLAVPALITPVGFETHVLWRDFGTMAALTLLLVLFAYGFGSRPIITRFEGCVMILSWIGYNTLLYTQA